MGDPVDDAPITQRYPLARLWKLRTYRLLSRLRPPEGLLLLEIRLARRRSECSHTAPRTDSMGVGLYLRFQSVDTAGNNRWL